MTSDFMSFDAPVVAVLGPTNTGKTHLAIERMLGHKSGMIGFPLRLLARENYDKVAARVGVRHVALITGEEKIIPPEARYFICTVESMPTDRAVEFLAVDEIQLAGDPERGHIFTDRLMRSRGLEETMFLGAETIRPLLKTLIPKARFEKRERLSRLTYIGPRKITKLPRRTAVVAFSAAEVYAIAELVRRQRGGAAVVMGALSPRTRNAQVAMYQEGEVDYLIATDAIGMGLNMDIDHVAFAASSKFDGRYPRRLIAAEVAQIAGRAGRFQRDGTFGVTGDCRPLDEEIIDQVEGHTFPALRNIYWRNTDLSFRTLRDLKRSLEERAPHQALFRKRDAEDHQALEALSQMPEITERATSVSRIKLLWDVCQIPDFQKSMTESHARLLGQIYGHLTTGVERLPPDWVQTQMSRFDKIDGDIDTLAGRIAHIRTWTYVTHHGEWISDPIHWQQRARAIEDRLSDALHDRLTQRFVDKRAATLVRKLTEEHGELTAAVQADGAVVVEGHRVGHLEGLDFVPEDVSGQEGKPVLAAARRVLPGEIARRIARLLSDDGMMFSLDERGRFLWRGAPVGQLEKGETTWTPQIRASRNELIESAQRERLEKKLVDWFDAHVEAGAPRLAQLKRADLSGPARGVVFQVLEGLGSASAETVAPLVKDLDEEGRKDVARVGIRLGTESAYVPDLLKPKAVKLRAVLWSIAKDAFPEEGPPADGRVQVARNPETPAEYDAALGFARLGGRAVRVDMLERVAALVRKSAREGKFGITADMLSLTGADHETFGAMLLDMGYRQAGADEEEKPLFQRRRRVDQRREGEDAGKGEGEPRRRRKRRPAGVSPQGTPQPAAGAASGASDTAGDTGSGAPATAAAPGSDAAPHAPRPQGNRPPQNNRGPQGGGRPRGGPNREGNRGPKRESGPKSFSAGPAKSSDGVDPDSPFAVLAKLKQSMKSD
jgi:ATP-dependent RNA helicase SUPV3L1/SUV3